VGKKGMTQASNRFARTKRARKVGKKSLTQALNRFARTRRNSARWAKKA
jgi:hypothetical protein